MYGRNRHRDPDGHDDRKGGQKLREEYRWNISFSGSKRKGEDEAKVGCV